MTSFERAFSERCPHCKSKADGQNGGETYFTCGNIEPLPGRAVGCDAVNKARKEIVASLREYAASPTVTDLPDRRKLYNAEAFADLIERGEL